MTKGRKMVLVIALALVLLIGGITALGYLTTPAPYLAMRQVDKQFERGVELTRADIVHKLGIPDTPDGIESEKKALTDATLEWTYRHHDEALDAYLRVTFDENDKVIDITLGYNT